VLSLQALRAAVAGAALGQEVSGRTQAETARDFVEALALVHRRQTIPAGNDVRVAALADEVDYTLCGHWFSPFSVRLGCKCSAGGSWYTVPLGARLVYQTDVRCLSDNKSPQPVHPGVVVPFVAPIDQGCRHEDVGVSPLGYLLLNGEVGR
jgi:hypothetical protein